MSFIQNIRDKSAILVFVLIILALLAFLLQDAFVGNTSGLFRTDDERGIILKIDKEEIPIERFRNIENNVMDNYTRQGVELNDNMRYTITRGAWDEFANGELVRVDASKLGVRVMQWDVDNLFLGDNVPMYIKQQFTRGNPAAYNKEEVRNYLAEIQKLKNTDARKKEFTEKLLTPLIDKILSDKYLSFFTMADYTPKWLKKKNADDDKKVADGLSYVVVPYSAVSEDKISISENDYNTYFNTHKARYVSDRERRYLHILTFNALPTKADEDALLTQFQKFREGFEKTQDDGAFLLRCGSTTKFDGAYWKARDMQAGMPHRSELIQLRKGQVFGPYRVLPSQAGDNGLGYMQLAKLVNTRMLPDSVLCRHILISVSNPNTGEQTRTDSVAHALADSMQYYISKGIKFDNLVTKYSDDEGSKQKGGIYAFSYANYSQLAPEFARFVFSAAMGERKVIKTTFGYHYVEVLAKTNVSPAWQFAFITRKIQPSKATRDSVLRMVNNFASSIHSAKELLTKARADHYPIFEGQQITEEDYTMPALSNVYARSLVKWAFSQNAGMLSDVFVLGHRYVLVGLADVVDAGKLGALYGREQLHADTRRQKTADYLAEANKLQSMAQIADAYHSKAQQINALTWATETSAQTLDERLVGAAFASASKISAVPTAQGVYFMHTNKIVNSATDTPASLMDNAANNTYIFSRSLLGALKKVHTYTDNFSTFY